MDSIKGEIKMKKSENKEEPQLVKNEGLFEVSDPRELRSMCTFESFQDEVVGYPVFLPPSSQIAPQGGWDSPLWVVGDLLKTQGVNAANLRAAMLCFLALNSAHVGCPIAVEVGDDEESEAVGLLNACMNLVPENHTIEFPRISLEILLRERAQIQGRAIVGFNGDGYRKEAELINLYLGRQFLQTKETVRAKYGMIFEQVGVTGPTGCVLVNRSSEDPILRHPSFIRVRLDSDSEQLGQNRSSIENSQIQKYYSWVKASLERLRPYAVKIPFIPKLRDHLINSRVEHPQQKLETLARVLSIITILNNPPPLVKSELYARLLGYDFNKNLTQSDPSKVRDLVATRLDYCHLFFLMDGLWESQDNSLNSRQKAIYEAVKAYNTGYLNSNTFASTEAPTKTLVAISENPNCWISMEKLFEKVNDDGGETLSLSTVYRELRNLQDKEVIRGQNDAKARNKKLYAINTLDIRENIRLPLPSEIDCATFKHQPIQVISPISGEVETF
jgi:hypothetical protein